MPDSSVKAAYCSCAAGLSQCYNHVVNVLYKINDAVEQGMFSPLCTERSCVWNASAKNIEPTQVRKMSIAEHKQLKESRKILFNDKRLDYVPRPECQRFVTDAQKQSLLNRIKNIFPKLFSSLIFALRSNIRGEQTKGLTTTSRFYEVYSNMYSIQFNTKSKPGQVSTLL